jgi:hypothetical protein
MAIIEFIKKILFGKQPKKEENKTIYETKPEIEEIHSIWDYIKFNENTQAAHILTVVGFEEWVTMEEILRRIKELFGVDYQNKRSLYPYVKTLVDVGLLETTNIGEKKKWRKKDILIKVKVKDEIKKKEEEKIVINTT